MGKGSFSLISWSALLRTGALPSNPTDYADILLYELLMNHIEIGPAKVQCILDRGLVFRSAVLLILATLFTIGIASFFAEFFFLNAYLNGVWVINLHSIDFDSLTPTVDKKASGIWEAINMVIGDGDSQAFHYDQFIWISRQSLFQRFGTVDRRDGLRSW